MIISNSQTQRLTLFFIGSNIISLIKQHQFNSIEPLILYNNYCERVEHISISYFLFGLDWVYISGLAESNESGDIILCKSEG